MQLDEMKGKLKKQKKTMKEKMDKLSKIHQTQLSEVQLSQHVDVSLVLSCCLYITVVCRAHEGIGGSLSNQFGEQW